MDIHNGETIGLVVETHCNYFSSLAFPEPITVGLRVEKMGTSSVRYGLAIFGQSELAAAQGRQFQAVLDDAMRDYLERQTKTRPRQHVMASFASSLEEFDSLYRDLAK